MRTTLPASTIAWIALAMALVALADAQTTQVCLWPLYIGPVVVASWLGELRHGAATSLAAAALLVVSARFSGHPYASDLYFLVAKCSQCGALLVITWLANRLASTQALLLRVLGPDESASMR